MDSTCELSCSRLTITLLCAVRKASCGTKQERGILVLMKTKYQINQDAGSQNQSVADAAETLTPHFDDIAVAIAQPVQPLATPSHNIKSSAHVLRSLLLALLACVVVATLATAVSLFGLPRHEETSDALDVTNASESAQEDISGGSLQSNGSMQLTQRPRRHRRKFAQTKPDQVIVIAEDDEGRPLPHKFGAIRIGRGSDRP